MGEASVLALVSLLVVATSAWTFDESDVEGPSRWGYVLQADGSLRDPLCASGRRQSPIALPPAPADPAASFARLVWLEGNNLTATNDGRRLTVRVNDVVSHVLDAAGREFRLIEVRVGAPASHAVGGGVYDAEIVIAHERTITAGGDGGPRFVIVVIPVVASHGHHVAFNELIDLLPTFEGGAAVSVVRTRAFNLQALLPLHRGAVAYEGSLLHPPCTEDAAYLVMDSPLTISHPQLEALLAKRNDPSAAFASRPPQALHGRAAGRVPAAPPRQLPRLTEVEALAADAVLALVAIGLSGLASCIGVAALILACCASRSAALDGAT